VLESGCLVNGRRVDREEKLRRMFPPGLEEIHFIDEVIEGEAKEEVKRVGPVMLKIDVASFVALNHQTFEEAFQKNGIKLETDFIILPNDIRVDARETRIRQYLELNIDEETEIKWDPVAKEIPRKVIRPEIELEDGWIDNTATARMIDLDEETVFDLEKKQAAEITIRTVPSTDETGPPTQPGPVQTIKETAEEISQNKVKIEEDESWTRKIFSEKSSTPVSPIALSTQQK
jgi:hypothetical protein